MGLSRANELARSVIDDMKADIAAVHTAEHARQVDHRAHSRRIPVFIPSPVPMLVGERDKHESNSPESLRFNWPTGDLRSRTKLKRRLATADDRASEHAKFLLQARILRTFYKQGYLEVVTGICEVVEVDYGLGSVKHTAETVDAVDNYIRAATIQTCYNVIEAICQDFQVDLGYIAVGQTKEGSVVMSDPRHLGILSPSAR